MWAWDSGCRAPGNTPYLPENQMEKKVKNEIGILIGIAR